MAAATAAALALALVPAVALGAVDLPPPSVTGTAGDGGWFVGDVVVKWSPTGETATTGCETQHLTVDTPGVTITCTATDDVGGGSVSRTVTVRVDHTPPAGVVATPARPPDAPPFYTAPVSVAWSATDVTSGVASCTTLTYAGPDGAVTPAGSCRDRAGNVSAPVAFPLAYDTTAPALADLAATVAADRTATLRWSAAPDAQSVSVVRNPGDGGAAARVVLDGPGTTHELADGPLTAGMTYAYSVTVRDAAGNATTATTTATVPAAVIATGPPTKPKTETKAKTKAKRPTLSWRAQPKATYYNVQLFRDGHKVLSAWPTVPRYALKARWRHHGKTYSLKSGGYRWYVWPGYGPRAAHRYGHLLAHGRVTVPRS